MKKPVYNKGKGAGIAWLRNACTYTGDNCLIWPFGTCHGYGCLSYLGRVYRSHRLMCEWKNGPAPSGTYAAHSCGKGHLGCCNPMHLSWKTPSENHLDRRLHGTTSIWSRRGKLSVEQVKEIRSLRGVISQQQIAERFGVSRSCINEIHAGRTWVKEKRGYSKIGERYHARIRVSGKHIRLGTFATAEEASAAYERAAAEARALTAGDL